MSNFFLTLVLFIACCYLMQRWQFPWQTIAATPREDFRCFNGPVILLDVVIWIVAKAWRLLPYRRKTQGVIVLRVSSGSQAERLIIEILSGRSLSW